MEEDLGFFLARHRLHLPLLAGPSPEPGGPLLAGPSPEPGGYAGILATGPWQQRARQVLPAPADLCVVETMVVDARRLLRPHLEASP